MSIFEHKLRPIEIIPVSLSKSSDGKTRAEFDVTFQIEFFFHLKRMSFKTRGLYELTEAFDEQSLKKLLETTDYINFVNLNMKHRNHGSFYYLYGNDDNLISINYTTF